MTVHVVEDSARVRHRLSRDLDSVMGVELLGYSESAPEAINTIRSVQPDLVVLDLQLAEGSGGDVLSAFPSEGWHPLFVVLSNLSVPQVRADCLRRGASQFFDKSHQYPEFLQMIESLASIEN
jgi:DNA-binding NarL/FixJ family response regulator